MNKSDCCNAEVRIFENGKDAMDFIRSNPVQGLPMYDKTNGRWAVIPTNPKPKTTKYYEVKYTIDNFEHYTVLTANDPIDAQKKFESSNYQAIVRHIKLLEIIQEDTTNQE